MKKPKVLVLQGRFNTGKTTTLNLLIDLFVMSGSKMTKESVRSNSIKKDSAVLLRYKSKRIAIVTVGDYWKKPKCRKDIIESITEGLRIIKQFEKPTCDLYVFAARTSGDTIDSIKEFAETKLNTTVECLKTTPLELETKDKNYSTQLITLCNIKQAIELRNTIESLLFAD